MGDSHNSTGERAGIRWESGEHPSAKAIGSDAYRKRPYAGGSVILSDQTSQLLPAELAPFLAEAREQLQEATEGLQPHEVIQHLETTVAEAEAEASRLGLHIGAAAVGVSAQAASVESTDGPVVVIRQTIEPDDA